MFVAVALRALSLKLSTVWLGAAPVIVAPPPHATGVCPTAAEVESSLAARFPGAVRSSDSAPAPGQLRLVTALAPNGLRLELRNERGEVVLKRLLPREGREPDCRALADSMALIVERYVRALPEAAGTVVPEKGPTPDKPSAAEKPAPAERAPAPPAPSRPAPPPSAPPPEPVAPVEEPPPSPPPASPPRDRDEEQAERPSPPPSEPVGRPTPETPPTAARGDETHGHVLSLHGGGRWSDGRPSGSWEGRLGWTRVTARPAAGWIFQVEAGFTTTGTVSTAPGTMSVDTIPARLGAGRSVPLGFGQLELTVGAGGHALLRSFTPVTPGAPTSRSWNFTPTVSGQGAFRAWLSERVSLLLSVEVAYAFLRYDVGLTYTDNRATPAVIETPRVTLTPLLGLGIRLF